MVEFDDRRRISVDRGRRCHVTPAPSACPSVHWPGRTMASGSHKAIDGTT
jgi:hypothetical protein